jgi:hypothetical protein
VESGDVEYMKENLAEERDVSDESSDNDMLDITESEWSSDDERWDFPLSTNRLMIRTKRIETVLKTDAWQNTNYIDIREAFKIAKLSVFPASSVDSEIDSGYKRNSFNMKLSVSPTSSVDNEMDSEYKRDSSDITDDIAEKEEIQATPVPEEQDYRYTSPEHCSSGDEYLPGKEDVNTSDSNVSSMDEQSDSEGFIEVISKQKRRNKQNVFKSNTGARKRLLLHQHIESDISIAKQKSTEEEKKRKSEYSLHSKRLNTLIKSNGLRSEHVPAHSNCFFEAAAKLVEEKNYALTLRQKRCDHLQDNEDYYSSFLTSNSVLYSNEVSLLRTAGTWTNELADALPLALANSLSITVRIYSSSVNQPVITIVPSLVEQVDNELLTLAYLRARNCEHYDPVVPKQNGYVIGRWARRMLYII